MTDDDDAALDALLATIFAKYHYDFRSYARASLHRRVANAITQLRVTSVNALRDRIAEDPAAFGALLPWFTVQVSDLFRDPPYFRHFREHIVPVLHTYPSRKLWVAGCSTGEEAYSFAILLAEEGLLDRTLIYATDIYGQSLRAAEAGVYELDRMRTFSEHIVFADHSLATDTVFAECQVVSCRNVLIYFNQVLQDRALGLFRDSLVRHGWLGLGPKETVEFSAHKAAFAHHAERWYQLEARR
jgi:chemotaxis protein methyltransferase CheR